MVNKIWWYVVDVFSCCSPISFISGLTTASHASTQSGAFSGYSCWVSSVHFLVSSLPATLTCQCSLYPHRPRTSLVLAFHSLSLFHPLLLYFLWAWHMVQLLVHFQNFKTLDQANKCETNGQKYIYFWYTFLSWKYMRYMCHCTLQKI